MWPKIINIILLVASACLQQYCPRATALNNQFFWTIAEGLQNLWSLSAILHEGDSPKLISSFGKIAEGLQNLFGLRLPTAKGDGP